MSKVATAPSLAELVGMLRMIRTSTLADTLEQHGFHGAMDARIHNVVNPDRKLVGPAITLKKTLYQADAPEAKLSPSYHLFAVLNEGKPGDVLVIDAEGAMNAASFGDLAAHAARARGVEGCVCDGAIRDVVPLRGTGIAVYAPGIHTSSGIKRLMSIGFNMPVQCGGVPVQPGDYIVGDEDGVVVIPRAMLEAVTTAAYRSEQTEYEESSFLEATGDFVEAYRRFGHA